MPTLVLWDIDGTLIKGGPDAMSAFKQALREVYELSGELKKIDYGGKADPQIVLETLALYAIEEAAALDRMQHFHSRYVDLVRADFARPEATLHVLPGATEVIAALADAGAAQSTLTGNLRDTAELKLRAAGLLEHIDLESGAFGSDHCNRNELVSIARTRATARHGPLEQVVVVGDTPRDIDCGRAGGARTVGVATGSWSYDDLLQHAPDALLIDLQDVDAALAAILQR